MAENSHRQSCNSALAAGVLRQDLNRPLNFKNHFESQKKQSKSVAGALARLDNQLGHNSVEVLKEAYNLKIVNLLVYEMIRDMV